MPALLILLLALLLVSPGGAGHAATLPAGMPLTRAFAHDLLDAALAAAGAGDAFELRLDQPRLPLAPGRVLTERDLQPPRLVQRGRAVELIYARPGLRLRALGVAQADGALGELVQVVNAESQQRLQGLVVGPDQVALGGTLPAQAGLY